MYSDTESLPIRRVNNLPFAPAQYDVTSISNLCMYANKNFHFAKAERNNYASDMHWTNASAISYNEWYISGWYITSEA